MKINVLQNYDIAVKATEKSINSQNSALEENEKYLSSIEGRYATFKVQLEETYLSIVSSDFLKGTISGLSTFTSLIKDSVENVGLLGTVLGGLGVYLTTFKDKFKVFDFNVNTNSIGWTDGFRQKLEAIKTSAKNASNEMKIMSQVNTNLGLGLTPLQKLSAGFRAVGASAKFAQIQAIAFKGATALLNGAVGLFGGVIAGMAISGIMSWIMNIGKADEKTKEFIQTCQSNISTNNDSIKSLTSLKGEYEELSSATNLNAEQSKRLVEVKNELGRLSPSLIAGYTEEGDIILKQNANIQDQIDLLNKKNKIESKKIIDEALKNDGGTENKIKDSENKISKLKTGDVFKGQDSIDKYLKAMEDAEKRIMNAKTEAEAKMYQKQYDEAYDKYYKMNDELQEAKKKIDTLREGMESLKPHVLAVNDSFQSMDKPTQDIVNNILEADNALKEAKSSEEYVSRIRKIIDLINSSNTAPFIKEINDLNEKFKDKGATEEYKKALDGIIQKILALPNLKNLGIDKDMLTKALSVNASEVDLSGVDKAIDKVAELNAMSSEDLGKNFNEITKKIQDLNEVLYNLDNGKLVGQNLSNAIEKYPELLGLLGDEADMRKYITGLIAEENEVQTQTYQAMIENSQAFYDAKVKGNTELVNRITELYGVDLTQFNTLAEAKLEIERRLIEKLAGYWSKYYDVASKSFDMEQATKDTHDVGRARYYQQQANMAELEMMNQKAEFDKLIGELSKPVDFKKINMGKSQVKDATKKEKKKKEKKDKDPFVQDTYENNQKRLNTLLAEQNRLIEESARGSKKHVEAMKQKLKLMEKQLELMKMEAQFQKNLAYNAVDTSNTGSSSSGGTTSGNASYDDVLQKAVDNYVGKVKYKFGSRNINSGTIDCSGFVVEMLKQAGMYFDSNAEGLVKHYTSNGRGFKVDKNNIKKGDIIYFNNTYKKGISHIGIAMDDKGTVMHAGSSKGVTLDNINSGYLAKHYGGAVRVNGLSTTSNNYSNVKPTKANNKQFVVTYYTDLPSENGGYTTNAYGQKLKKGMVASNYYKKGTKIYLEGIGEVEVADKGGSAFNKDNRLDIFVPRNAGESDSAYKKRVNAMGKKTVNGTIGGSGGVGDTSYITNQNRQQAYTQWQSLEAEIQQKMQEINDLKFEIKKASVTYEFESTIEKLDSIVKRSELFANNMTRGSEDQLRNLTKATDEYAEIAKNQENIKNNLYKLAQDQTLTEAQRVEVWKEYYQADLKYWEAKNAQQEAYLKTLKEQFYGKNEVDINYKEGVKKRNLTNTSYYMENTPENLKALENALKIQREIAEIREKEKNDAYKLYTDKEYTKNLTPKQIEDLKQEYMDRDNVFYEARKELDELTKKTYEVKLEAKLSVNNKELEKIRKELEILQNIDPENYKEISKKKKQSYSQEKIKENKLRYEINDNESDIAGMKAYIELLKKYSDDESKRAVKEAELKLKTLQDIVDSDKEKLAQQEIATSQALREYVDAIKAEYEFKFNVELEISDDEIARLQNKISALDNYNSNEYSEKYYDEKIKMSEDVLKTDKKKYKDIQDQIKELNKDLEKLEEQKKNTNDPKKIEKLNALIKDNIDLTKDKTKELDSQEVAISEIIKNLADLYNEKLQFKLDIKLEVSDDELKRIQNKISTLESYNPTDYSGILELNKESLFIENEKEKDMQKHLVDLLYEKAQLEEKTANAKDKNSEEYLLNIEKLERVNDGIKKTNAQLSDQEAIIAQQVKAYIDAQRNLLDNQTQNAIFGKDKADYEYEMGLRIDDYNKQIKAIEDEAKFLTGDEKKWQIDLIRDDIKSESRILENPAQKARIEAFYEELKVLESIDNLEQDRVDKVKYQLDIEKAKIKLENLQNQKSIRALKKGEDGTFKWTYVADQDAIDQAQKELKEKQYEFSKWTTDKDREDRKEAIQDKIDAESEKYDNMVKSYEAQMRLIDQNLKAQAVLIMQAKKEENEKFKKALEDKQKIADEKGAEEVKNLIDHNTIMNDTLDAGLKTLKETNELQWTSMVNTTSEKVKEMQRLIADMIAEFNRINSLKNAIASANAELQAQQAKNASLTSSGSGSKSTSSNSSSNGKSIAQFAKGGLTGKFSGGKLAVLHEEEAIFNKFDTKNLLEVFKQLPKLNLPKITSPIEMLKNIKINQPLNPIGNTIHLNNVKFEFPNIESGSGLKQAIYDLPNVVDQFNSKNK